MNQLGFGRSWESIILNPGLIGDRGNFAVLIFHFEVMCTWKQTLPLATIPFPAMFHITQRTDWLHTNVTNSLGSGGASETDTLISAPPFLLPKHTLLGTMSNQLFDIFFWGGGIILSSQISSFMICKYFILSIHFKFSFFFGTSFGKLFWW